MLTEKRIEELFRKWFDPDDGGNYLDCWKQCTRAIEAEVAPPLQARIDELMLEYCPEEMSDEQVAEWGRHQRPVSEAEVRAEAQEPVAWFAFADSNGPVPLELWGFDEKACKHAVLENARSVGWKGTVEGYLFQKSWAVRPLVFAAPQPPAPCPKCASVEARLHVLIDRAEYKALKAKVAELGSELERERMRLAACGVVALANTPESATKARTMLPEYHSASLDDVARTVDSEMALRAKVAEQSACIKSLGEAMTRQHNSGEKLAARIMEQSAEIERLKKVALFKESVCALYVADIDHQTEIANNFATQVRQQNTTIAELKSKASVLNGLPQDAINGGWTYRGMEAYARGLEAKVAGIEQAYKDKDDAATQLVTAMRDMAGKIVVQSAEIERLKNSATEDATYWQIHYGKQIAQQSALIDQCEKFAADIPGNGSLLGFVSESARMEVLAAIAAYKCTPSNTDTRDAYEQISDFSKGNYRGL